MEEGARGREKCVRGASGRGVCGACGVSEGHEGC